MILTIDIGNTNIVTGCFEDDKLLFVERFSTNHAATALEHVVMFSTIFRLHDISPEKISGGIISSVVPAATAAVRRAVERLIGCKLIVLAPGLKTGVSIVTDDPSQVGSDLVAGAAASVTLYDAPQIVIDIGTATTVTVINDKKQYIGNLIIPGPVVSLESLTNAASQLTKVSIDAPKHVVGRNTTEAMKSGILYSHAGALDGIIDRIEEELGMKCTVIATGGLACLITPHCKREIILNDELLLRGLLIIYNKNI